MVREEDEPTLSDFSIGPGSDDIRACAEDGVVVVFHDGVSDDLNGEDCGKFA